MRAHWPLFLILALFAGWCVAFNAATPYRQGGVLLLQRDPATGQAATAPDIGAPDERQHANYVAGLLRGEGFPVFKPRDPNLYETYQAHQPPLYYVIAAGWSTLVGIDPTTPADGFRLRLLNTLYGLGTLLGVYWAARWGLGRADVAYAATAFVGLLPMFIALHGAVSNDPLLYLICTWTLALCIRSLAQGWTVPRLVSVGVLIGLGLLTKTTALALLPLAAVALALSWGKIEPTSRRTPALLALFVLPLVMAAPWFARNMQLYGDPLAISAFNQAFVGSPPASAFIQQVGMGTYLIDFVGWWTSRSFYGAFGYMDIFLFEGIGQTGAWIYRLLIAALVGLCLFGIAALWRPSRLDAEADDPDASPSPHAVLWLCLALTFVVKLLFLRFNLQYFQGQARYLYPAIAATGILVAAAVVRLAGLYRAWAWVAVAALMSVLDISAYSTLVDGFARRVISG